MDDQNKRTADRVPCRVPLVLNCAGAPWRGTAVDVSRTGLRLKLPLSALGLDGVPTLLTLAHRLSEVLPPRAPVTFDPGRLGTLIQRDLEIVRVGLSAGRDPQVELACRFDHALTEIDAAAIGVDVPQPPGGKATGDMGPASDGISSVAMRNPSPLPRKSTPPARPGPNRLHPPGALHRADTGFDAPFPPPLTSNDSPVSFNGPPVSPPVLPSAPQTAPPASSPDARHDQGTRPAMITADGMAHFQLGAASSLDGCLEPRLRQRCRRFRVHLNPMGGTRPHPVLGWTERLDADSLSVLVPQRARLDLPPEAQDVRTLLAAFCEQYGTRFQMSVMDGTRTVWDGPVSIRAAEIYHAHADALVLDLEFATRLQPAQVRELGLT